MKSRYSIKNVTSSIVASGLLTAILLCLSPFSATVVPASRPSIVLITIDTLRADHLKCYGYKSATSPNLDRFAKDGILFQKAYSAVPLTLPSHATMLSGLYPEQHGIRDNAHFPLTKSPLVQQILKSNGYTTAAFVSGAPLAANFGLDRGFDYYDDEFPGTERKADDTTKRVLAWLQEKRGPYFLWIHYFDPHAEYEPPAEFRKQFPNSLYDGEIAFVDREIGRLLGAISRDAYLLIAADHGESLGEHGETTHAVFVYNATLHVPLLLRGPNLKPEVRTDPVSLTDIAPTILEMAEIRQGIPHPDGASLLKKNQNRNLIAESLYSKRNFGYAPLYACIRQQEKYIQAPQPELYDLQSDPAEQRNLIRQRKIPECLTALSAYDREERQQPRESPSPEELEKLRSLGYVGASVKQIGADPKTKISVIEKFRLAMIQLKEKQFDQAEKSFTQISHTEQHNGLAFKFLGDSLSAQRKYSEAAKAYSESLQLLPDPAVAVQLAKAYNRLEQPDRAEATLSNTIRQYPHYSEALFELSSFYASRQKWDAAFALLKRDDPEFHNQKGVLYLEKQEPQNAMNEFLNALKLQQKAFYWNNLGIAHQRLRQVKEAEAAFQKALKLNPDYEEGQANLAFLLIAEKRWQEAEPLLQKVTAKNSNLWRARFALGFVLENQNRKEAALSIYKKLLSDAPPNWPERPQVENRIRSLSR